MERSPYKPSLHVCLKVNKDCDKWTSWLIYFLIKVLLINANCLLTQLLPFLHKIGYR